MIKYNVNDKFSFHEVKDNYIPVIKRESNSVPVIFAAVGTRQHRKCTISFYDEYAVFTKLRLLMINMVLF